MSQKFCHNCGKKAEALWKACPYCETSFASLTERPKEHFEPEPPQRQHFQRPQQPTYNQQEPTFATINDDDGDTNYLDRISHYQPPMDALQVEISKPVKPGETFGTIATSPFVNVIDSPRTPPPSVSQEEFLRQFQNEAGGAAKRIDIN